MPGWGRLAHIVNYAASFCALQSPDGNIYSYRYLRKGLAILQTHWVFDVFLVPLFCLFFLSRLFVGVDVCFVSLACPFLFVLVHTGMLQRWWDERVDVSMRSSARVARISRSFRYPFFRAPRRSPSTLQSPTYLGVPELVVADALVINGRLWFGASVLQCLCLAIRFSLRCVCGTLGCESMRRSMRVLHMFVCASWVCLLIVAFIFAVLFRCCWLSLFVCSVFACCSLPLRAIVYASLCFALLLCGGWSAGFCHVCPILCLALLAWPGLPFIVSVVVFFRWPRCLLQRCV